MKYMHEKRMTSFSRVYGGSYMKMIRLAMEKLF